MHAKKLKVYNNIPTKQHGFTLIEILIALALGLLIIGGAFSYFLSTLKTSKAMLSQSKLQQEIRSSVGLIQRDLRRAGYRPNGDVAPVSTVYIGTTGGANNCILYSYVDERGTLRQGGFLRHSDNRFYMYVKTTTGYTSSTAVNTICPSDASPSTWATTSNNWIAVTPSTASSATVNSPLVTGFTVSNTVANPQLVTITLSGTMSKDSAVNFSLKENIMLQNTPAIATATTGS